MNRRHAHDSHTGLPPVVFGIFDVYSVYSNERASEVLFRVVTWYVFLFFGDPVFVAKFVILISKA